MLIEQGKQLQQATFVAKDVNWQVNKCSYGYSTPYFNELS